MTEWDAAAYSKQSALQKWLADNHLARVGNSGQPHVFRFYQMEVVLRPA